MNLCKVLIWCVWLLQPSFQYFQILELDLTFALGPLLTDCDLTT